MSSTRLFIRSLPFKLSQDGFTKYFQTFGPVVDAKVITDRITGLSRGFGFVTFENEKDAEKVVSRQNLEIDGRQIFAEISTGTGGSRNDGAFSSRPFYQRDSPFEGNDSIRNSNSALRENYSNQNFNNQSGNRNQNEDEFGSF